MSYAQCMGCGQTIRDWDNPYEKPLPLGIPPHDIDGRGTPCPDPRGMFTWNNGHNYWDEDAMAYREYPSGGPAVEIWYGPRCKP